MDVDVVEVLFEPLSSDLPDEFPFCEAAGFAEPELPDDPAPAELPFPEFPEFPDSDVFDSVDAAGVLAFELPEFPPAAGVDPREAAVEGVVPFEDEFPLPLSSLPFADTGPATRAMEMMNDATIGIFFTIPLY